MQHLPAILPSNDIFRDLDAEHLPEAFVLLQIIRMAYHSLPPDHKEANWNVFVHEIKAVLKNPTALFRYMNDHNLCDRASGGYKT